MSTIPLILNLVMSIVAVGVVFGALLLAVRMSQTPTGGSGRAHWRDRAEPV